MVFSIALIAPFTPYFALYYNIFFFLPVKGVFSIISGAAILPRLTHEKQMIRPHHARRPLLFCAPSASNVK